MGKLSELYVSQGIVNIQYISINLLKEYLIRNRSKTIEVL